MKVSLDGGITYKECDEVRVIYEGLDDWGEDKEGILDLYLTMTSEGLIQDVYKKSKVHRGQILVGTSSQMAQEIVDYLNVV